MSMQSRIDAIGGPLIDSESLAIQRLAIGAAHDLGLPEAFREHSWAFFQEQAIALQVLHDMGRKHGLQVYEGENATCT